MKFVILQTNKELKLTFLILLLVSFEVLSITNKSTYEINKLQVIILKLLYILNYLQSFFQKLNNYATNQFGRTKPDIKTISNNIRFKSQTKGDSDESNDILVNSVVTDAKKT